MKQLLTILLFSIALCCVAQRRVTPVEDKRAAITTLEGKAEAKKLLDKNVRASMLFSDTIITDSIINPVDTTKRREVMIAPLLNNITIGVNVWDPIMRATGQKYGLVDFSAELNLYNRFIPAIEMGLGVADNKPEDMNFRYKTPLSWFGKIGANYNFLYNKDHDYQFCAGLRFGFTAFKYSITEIDVNSPYWGTNEQVEILDQSSNASWMEILMGLRVKIYRNISMGWFMRYHRLFSVKENKNSSPWYVPGYGHRNRSITGSFSVYYTLPLHRKSKTSKTDEIIQEIDAQPDLKPAEE